MPFNENVDYSTINVTKGTPPALVPSSEIDKLVANITNATSGSNKMGDDEVTVALAIICQKGGTAKKANPNIYANVNGKVLELGLVRKVITDINWKYTLRQFARSKATFIQKTCSYFDIPGDLSQKLGRLDPSLGSEDKIWLSNFQMDNSDCPEKIRNMLMSHYDQMFGNNP